MPRRKNWNSGADRGFHSDGGARFREQQILSRVSAGGPIETWEQRIARLDAADRADDEAVVARLARQAAETRRLLGR